MIEQIWRDVRFAVRTSLRDRTFTLAVLFSLALGIGGTCAFFSVVYGILIDPYVYKDASRIIVPTFSEPDSDARRPALYYTLADFMNLQKGSGVFESMILTSSRMAITPGNTPQNVNVLDVSPNYFEFFGTPAFLGRTFAPGDVRHPQNPPPLAVIGHRFWLKEFNGSQAVIGRDLKVGTETYKVIGVMPPRFTWFDTDVFTLQPMRPQAQEYASVYLRLRKGVRPSSADAELQALTERAVRMNPAHYPKLPFQMHAVPLQEWLNGKASGKWLILLTAVGLLLLISCANVSVLLLSRSEARKQEIAMRFALGAGTSRIVRQLLTETLLLTLAGCVLGILFAWNGVPAILAALPETSVPHESVVEMNLPVLLFAVVTSLVAGLLVGLAPALTLARTTVQSGSRITGGSNRLISAQTSLITAEIALSAMLLVCGVVAIRNLVALNHADLGYNPRNVAVLTTSMARHRSASWQHRRAYFEGLERALLETPGVQSVAETTDAIPPSIEFEKEFSISGKLSAKAALGLVSSDYFKTLQTPIRSGRMFDAAEVSRGAQLAVVNEAMARRLMNKGVTPVGAQLQLANFFARKDAFPPGQTAVFSIVGVVATVENQNLQNASRPAIYLPYTHVLQREITFLVRTHGNPQLLENTFRKRLHGLVDADQPLAEFHTLQHILTVNSLSDAQSSAALFTIFASVAMVLAAFGVYSVVSFSVAQRNKEIAIRRALGAQSRQVISMILQWLLIVTAAGLGLGFLGTFAFGRMLAYYEQGWQPYNPMTLLAVTSLLLIVNVTAILPAVWRAVSILPDKALRLS